MAKANSIGDRSPQTPPIRGYAATPQTISMGQALLESIRDQYNIEAGLIMLADQSEKRLTTIAYLDYYKIQPTPTEFFFDFAEDAVVLRILQGQPDYQYGVYCEDVDSEEKHRFNSKGLTKFSINGRWLGLPLTFNNVTIGVLVFWCRTGKALTRSSLNELYPISLLGAASLFQTTQPRNQRRIPSSITDIQVSKEERGFPLPILRLITLGVTAAGFDRLRVFRIERITNEFYCVAAHPKSEHSKELTTFKERIENSVYSKDIQQTYLLNPTARIYDPRSQESLGNDPYCRIFNKPPDLEWAVVPIIVQGSLYGQIAADNALTRKHIDSLSLEALTILGALASHLITHLANLQQKRQLHIERTQHQSVLESVPQLSIWRKNENGVFTFANESFAHFLAAPSVSHILGKTDFDFFDTAQAQYFQEKDAAAHLKELYEDHEEKIHFKNGSTRHVHVIKKALTSPTGEPIGTQGILWDVTEEILAKKDLQASHKLLQLQSAAIQHSEFTALLSHDFGKATVQVTESIDLLRDKVIKAIRERRSFTFIEKPLDEAYDACRKLENRVSLIKRNAIETDTSPELFRIKPLIQQLFKDLEQTLSRYSMQYNLQIPDDIEAYGSPPILKGVVFNLVNNSIEAQKSRIRTRSNSIKVQAITLESSTNPSIIIKFWDQGPGINLSRFPNPNDIFQLGQSYKGKGNSPGTGTGLAVAQILLDRHFSGDLTLTDPNSAQFQIRLPAPKNNNE